MENPLAPNKKLEILQKLAVLSRVKNASELVRIAAQSKMPGLVDKLESYFGKIVAMSGADIHPFLPGPSADEVKEGDILLGILQDESPVMLPLSLLSQGVYIVGTTGSGKTWDLIFMCKQTMSRDIRVWIFDRENSMCKFFSDELREGSILLLNYKDFKRNPHIHRCWEIRH